MKRQKKKKSFSVKIQIFRHFRDVFLHSNATTYIIQGLRYFHSLPDIVDFIFYHGGSLQGQAKSCHMGKLDNFFFLLIFSEVRGVRLGGARLLIWARQRREKEEIHSAAREGILTDKDDVTAGRNRKGKPSEIFNRKRTLK